MQNLIAIVRARTWALPACGATILKQLKMALTFPSWEGLYIWVVSKGAAIMNVASKIRIPVTSSATTDVGIEGMTYALRLRQFNTN